MSSGRKERVMIACVTFETTKVTDPIEFYDCTRVHIIHYTKDTSPLKSVYDDFYNRVCEIIREQNGEDTPIIEHNVAVSNFTKVLSAILSIIESEQSRHDCDIFVNISAGSPEYSAAAAIAAMMSDNVLPFSVNSKEYTVSTEESITGTYYVDSKPVGLTKSTYNPRSLPKYSIDKPPEHLVKGLRLLNDLNEGKRRSKSSDIVPILKEKEVWFRDETKGNTKQSDAVHYHRDYSSKWIERGWVKKDELRKRLILTDEGKNIINTFYIDVPDTEQK